MLISKLMVAAPMWVGELIFDPLQHPSWGICAATGIVYTALTFSGVLQKEDAQIFSKQNAKPMSAILAVHAKFLAMPLGLMWAAQYIYPHLPNWMTDTFSVRGAFVSSFDILFLIVMGGAYLIERPLLFAESERHASDADNDPPQPTTIEKE